MVRRAVQDDADEIAACLATLQYGTTAAHVARLLGQWTSRDDASAFVSGAQTGGGLMGVVSACAIPLFHVPGQLVRFTAIAVRAGAERQGHGRALLAAAEAWAWSVGAVRIEITSGDHRDRAHSFYRALGYSEDERRFIKRAPTDR